MAAPAPLVEGGSPPPLEGAAKGDGAAEREGGANVAQAPTSGEARRLDVCIRIHVAMLGAKERGSGCFVPLTSGVG